MPEVKPIERLIATSQPGSPLLSSPETEMLAAIQKSIGAPNTTSGNQAGSPAAPDADPLLLEQTTGGPADQTSQRRALLGFGGIAPSVTVSATDGFLGDVTGHATGGIWSLPGLPADPAFKPQLEHPEHLSQSADYAVQLSRGKTVQQLIGSAPTAEDTALVDDAFELLGISNRQVAAYAEQSGRGGIDTAGLAPPALDAPAGQHAFEALKAAAQMRLAVDGGQPAAALDSLDHALLYQQADPRGLDMRGLIDSAIDGAKASKAYWSPTAAVRDLLLGGDDGSNVGPRDGAFKPNFLGAHFFDHYTQGVADGKALLINTTIDLVPDEALANAGRTLGMLPVNVQGIGQPAVGRNGLQILSAAAITALNAVGRGLFAAGRQGADRAVDLYGAGLGGLNALGRLAGNAAIAARNGGASLGESLAVGIAAGAAGYAGGRSPKFQGQFLSAAVLGGALLANEQWGTAGEESVGAKVLSWAIGTGTLALATGANGGANLPQTGWNPGDRAHSLLVAASFAKHFTAVTLPAGGATIGTSYLLGKFWGAQPEAEKNVKGLESYMKNQHAAEYDKFVSDITQPQVDLETSYSKLGNATAEIARLESNFGANYALTHDASNATEAEFLQFRQNSSEVQAQIAIEKTAKAEVLTHEKELADLTEPFFDNAQKLYEDFEKQELR